MVRVPELNSKIILIGLAFLLIGVYAQSAEISGTCSSQSIQCELSAQSLELCNNSSFTETYKNYFSGEFSSWFSVIPTAVTLSPDQCAQLKVYTVANCYASPGTYSAQLNVQDGETLSLTCSLDLKQGHFVDVRVEPETQNATQCEEKTYGIVISNNTIVQNQNTERVDLTVSGLPDSWYVLEEERVLVGKGNPETIKLRVQAPCTADFGTYGFTVRGALPNPEFYSEDDGEYVLGQGQGIQILPSANISGNTINACLETPTEATVRVVNNGKLADNLRVSLEGPSFAKLDRSTLALNAGTEGTVKIKLSETTQEPKNYEMTLKVESALFDYSTSKTFSINLEDCYNLSVEKTAGDPTACVEENPVYKFVLSNDKTKAVDADISIEGIGADIDKARVSIAPGEDKEVTATLDVSGLAKKAQAKRTDLAVELVIDVSGSMVEKVNGKNKMEAAKEALINLVNNINEIDLGLRVFGQGSECEDSQLLVPVKNLDIANITDKVSAFAPKGKTPLTQALEASIADFPAGKEKAIILVSDGKETCEGNISQAGRNLAAQNVKVYSIGFDIDADGKTQLQEIASRTQGKYFDAANSGQLLDVLQKISQELDIVPSNTGKKIFTLKVDSSYFSFEKDYSIEVSDCYNSAMVVPELNVCPGTTKNEVVTLANLGTEKQEFVMSYAPSWVKGPATVTVEGNSKETVPISAQVPAGSDERVSGFTVKASSPKVSLEQEKSVNYLSSASCFGIDLIVPEPELDAATCEGVKQTIMVENRGVVAQTVTFTTDKGYVYLVEPTIRVEPGERKDFYFFVSPPFDLPASTLIKLDAVTDRGFRTGATIKLMVSGNEESFGLGEVNIEVKDLSFTKVEGLNYDAEAQFSLYNDSNRTLEVQDAQVLDFNGVVQLENRFIKARDSVKAKIFVDLPENFSAKTVTIPVSLKTDEGTFTRNIVFGFEAEAPPQEPVEVEEPVSIGTGLFSLATVSTAILGFLVLLVIGLILLSAYNASKKEEPKETPEEKKERLEELKDKLAGGSRKPASGKRGRKKKAGKGK